MVLCTIKGLAPHIRKGSNTIKIKRKDYNHNENSLKLLKERMKMKFPFPFPHPGMKSRWAESVVSTWLDSAVFDL